MKNPTGKRLVSLDAFRGMTIALMILVNIPGSWSYVYPPLEHANWNGCTPTDLVFPFFLFIVGTAMAFSFSKFNYKLSTDSLLKTIERTFLIFFIGLLLNYYPFFKHDLGNNGFFMNFLIVIFRLILSLIPFFLFLWILKRYFKILSSVIHSGEKSLYKTTYVLGLVLVFIILLFGLPYLLNLIPFYNKDVSHLRIMGVLQRIALAYGFAAIIVLSFERKYIPYVIAFILLLYWWLMWYFGSDNPFSLESSVARKIDLFVFGDAHVWHGKGIPFDPEGLLSTLPSIGTPLIGYLVGRYIKDNKDKFGKWFYYLIGSGIILMILGKIWDIYFPINKSIWTSSYVLYTGGLAILFLSLFYWLIDVKHYKKWISFFIVFGINPLFAFVIHVLWVKILLYITRWNGPGDKIVNGYSWLFHNIFQPIAGNMNGSLLFAVTHIIFFWAMLFILYKKNIIIKI